MGLFKLSLPHSPWETEGHGPLQISIPEEDSEWPGVWRDTIATLGYPVSMNPFSGRYYGALMTPESVQPISKQRSFVGSAYLQSARSRSNLTIWARSLVDKVVFDTTVADEKKGIVATGVQCTRNGETIAVHARKEVIISAGTYHSPKILELSGIGDANLLRPLGIDVVIDNPHVGENLQTHPYCTMAFEAHDQEGFQTLDDIIQQNPSAVAAAMESYQAQQSGPFTTSGLNATAQLPLPSQFGIADSKSELDRVFKESCEKAELGKTTPAFAKAHESFVYSMISSPQNASALYYSYPGFVMLEGEGKVAARPSGSQHWFTVAALLGHPLSRGSSHITSASSLSPGLAVDPKYLSHPFDVEVLARHVQQLETIFQTEPLAGHLVHGGKRLPSINNLSDLDEARDVVRQNAVSAHHHTGTCSMMPKELGGVVNEQLRVYGFKNLRVCDFSIAPLMIRCNPQATVYGIAEHGAQIIKSSS